MMKIFYSLLFMAIILSHNSLYAQQDGQYSQYMFNTLFYNPAYAGVEGVTKITAFHRSQWAGYTGSFVPGGAPTSQVLSFSTPVFRIRSGVGLHIVNDNLGPLNNLEAQLSYAYHLGLRNSKLSFGMRVGAYSQSIDFDKYDPIDDGDPFIQEGRISQIRPDLALGIYYRAEKLYIGAAFNHLLKAEFDFGIDQFSNPLENQVTLTAGYDYEFNYNLILTPSILVKTDLNNYSFDLSLIGTYNDKLWGGVSFRQGDAAIGMLGYSLFQDNSLKVGYAFDYIIKAQEAKEPTSHEIMLSYTLPAAAAGGKKIIRTPRFRH